MKRTNFSDQQIAFILRQTEEGTPVSKVCRKAGISEATRYNWRKKYGGLMPSEMKRLKQLEEENGKLKKLVRGPELQRLQHSVIPVFRSLVCRCWRSRCRGGDPADVTQIEAAIPPATG